MLYFKYWIPGNRLGSFPGGANCPKGHWQLCYPSYYTTEGRQEKLQGDCVAYYESGVQLSQSID